LRGLRADVFGLIGVLMVGVIPVSAQLQLHFQTVSREVVEERLKSYKGNDSRREATLKRFFQEAGCTGDKLTEQPVQGLQQPNIICELPGSTDSIIVVAAHFDHVDRGDGVVDNWSGASMLPSLYQALKDEPRRYTFLFISFAGEEMGLVGSKFYVSSLTPEQVSKIKLMVCMDTLALGPTEVWVSHSDPELIRKLVRIAHALKSPLTRMDVEKIGESDEESFRQREVPTITLHSLTQATLSVLHSPKDNYSEVHFNDYFQSYRLVSAYLAFLDQDVLATAPSKDSTPQKH